MYVNLVALGEGLLLSLLALVLATLAWLLIAIATGLDPQTVIATIIEGAVGSSFAWEQSLRVATPLLFTGLVVALPLRAGLLIIGGEGALIAGGLAAAVVALYVPATIALFAMLVVGSLAGAMWLGLAGWLRAHRGVHEALASLLLTYIIIAIVNQLIEGPLREPASLDKPATAIIPLTAQLAGLGSTAIHIGLPLGIGLCIVAQIFLSFSPAGYALRVGGGNPRAAKFAGLNRNTHILAICVLAGSLAGLGAALEISAVHHRVSASFTVLGYGYLGILVACLAGGNMLAIIPAALLIGCLDAGGGLLQRRLAAPAASAELMHGLLFVAVMVVTALTGRLRNYWLSHR